MDAVKNVFPKGVNVRVVDDVEAAVASAHEWRTRNAIFNSELDAFKAGKHKGALHLGVPGAILRASGLNATEITIKESVLRKHLKKHEISVEDVHNLPEALNNPLMVYEWGTKARSLIVITNFTLNDGRKITAAVKLERSGKRIEVNELSSVHGKSIERLLEEAVEKEPDFGKNKLKYVDKNKAAEWLSLASAPLAVARQSAQRLRLAEIIENFKNPSTEILEQQGMPEPFPLAPRSDFAKVAGAGDSAELWEQMKGLASMPVVGAMGKLTSVSVAGISKVKHPRAMFDLRKLYQDYAIADAYAEQITKLKKSGVSGEILEQWAAAKTPEAREQFFIDYENDPRIEKKDPGLREKLEVFDKVRGIALAQIKDTIEQTDKNLRMELENLDVESVSGADSKIDQEITKTGASASEVQVGANSDTSDSMPDEQKDSGETKDSVVKKNLTTETKWAYDEKNPRHWKAHSPNGALIYGEWEVVDARKVKFFDAKSEAERKYQGRDRETINSQAQVYNISDKMKPVLLGDDNYADRGAPIFNADGKVLSGNGRSLAIQTAYGLLPNASARALENGKAYRAFVEKTAKEKGIEIPEDAKEFPLLRRVVKKSELTEDEIAKDTNRDVKAEYSRAEAANENSEYFGRFVKHWNPGMNGDPRVEQNREFMQKFF
ncbi:MAG: hypothetical protein IJW12_00055, partial [Opitutales bacterium]|nr:hypothetical protein [Opitutales bacterium]